ncbi:MAG: hypothetical protein WA152_01560 [Microgenomates group bacterium]
MTVTETPALTAEARESYIRMLFTRVVDDNDKSSLAELNSIAQGRNDLPLARELLKKLEEKK